MLPPVSCFQDQEHPPCHPNLPLPFKEDVTLSSKQINIDYAETWKTKIKCRDKTTIVTGKNKKPRNKTWTQKSNDPRVQISYPYLTSTLWK